MVGQIATQPATGTSWYVVVEIFISFAILGLKITLVKEAYQRPRDGVRNMLRQVTCRQDTLQKKRKFNTTLENTEKYTYE